MKSRARLTRHFRCVRRTLRFCHEKFLTGIIRARHPAPVPNQNILSSQDIWPVAGTEARPTALFPVPKLPKLLLGGE